MFVFNARYIILKELFIQNIVTKHLSWQQFKYLLYIYFSTNVIRDVYSCK